MSEIDAPFTDNNTYNYEIALVDVIWDLHRYHLKL